MKGNFFDGLASTKRAVSAVIEKGEIALTDAQWSHCFACADVLPIEGADQKVFFINTKSGSCLELQGSQHLQAQLSAAGFSIQRATALVNSAQKKWHYVVLMLIFLALALAASYQWLLPSAAHQLAVIIPPSVKAKIGQQSYQTIYPRWFAPSKLTPAKIAQITRVFYKLESSRQGAGQGSKLYVVSSKIGPNAFNLPGNIFVITDELVNLVDGDIDVIAGVLAHEIGHAQHEHGLRSLIQTSAVLLVSSTIIGDYSSALAGVPAYIANMKFSRGFEREADTYSRNLLCTNAIDPAKTAIFFEKMIAMDKSKTLDFVPEYLLSHPKSQERVEFFKKPCR